MRIRERPFTVESLNHLRDLRASAVQALIRDEELHPTDLALRAKDDAEIKTIVDLIDTQLITHLENIPGIKNATPRRILGLALPSLPSRQFIKKAAVITGITTGVVAGGVGAFDGVSSWWGEHLREDRIAAQNAHQEQVLFEDTHILPVGKLSVASADHWQIRYIQDTTTFQKTSYHNVLSFTVNPDNPSYDLQVPEANPSWLDQHFGSSDNGTALNIQLYTTTKGQQVPEVTITEYVSDNKDVADVTKQQLLIQNNNVVFQLVNGKRDFYIQMKKDQFVPNQYDFHEVSPKIQ